MNHLAQDRAHETRLAGARWALQHENGLRRVEVSVDEGAHAALDLRVGAVVQDVVGHLVDGGALQIAPRSEEVPFDGKHGLGD
jgi:hypothetical protein